MNFIDKALADKLSGDDFLQAMADVYSEPEVREILYKYPSFISDIILLIDYDTVLQMDGLDEIILGSLKQKCPEIINVLYKCGADKEADIIKKATSLAETDKNQYEDESDIIYNQLAINNDYEAFWEKIRKYIDSNLEF